MKNFKKFINKAGLYMTAKSLNERYNILSKEQKAKVKIAVKQYHQPVKIAIEQAFFFNKIACDDINEYLRVNALI